MDNNLSQFTVRRQLLSERIAQQRQQLNQAYQHLEPTLRYMDYGVEGVRFFRRNPLSLAMGTATVSYLGGRIFSWVFGGQKTSRPLPGSPEASLKKQGGKKEFLITVAKRLWQAYQIYRHLRNQMP